MNAASQIIRRHFAAATLKALARKGITVLGTVAIPGDGPMPWANASTGYSVNDNGCGKVWTLAQTLEAAK